MYVRIFVCPNLKYNEDGRISFEILVIIISYCQAEAKSSSNYSHSVLFRAAITFISCCDFYFVCPPSEFFLFFCLLSTKNLYVCSTFQCPYYLATPLPFQLFYSCSGMFKFLELPNIFVAYSAWVERGVCKDRSRWRSVVSAYPTGQIFVCAVKIRVWLK